MGILYRNPFKGRPHIAYRRETTRNDGIAPNSEGYTINETWGALIRCWRGYKIAKKVWEKEKMLKYANRIRKLQYELGIAISEFPDIGIIGSGPDDVDVMCE